MPARIQRKRTKGWRLPPNTVIVDRTSRYGNTFTIAKAQELFGWDEATARDYAVDSFDRWLGGERDLWYGPGSDGRREGILAALEAGVLTGKDVACTCREGLRCHGDVLLLRAAMDPAALVRWARNARLRVNRHRVWRGEDPFYGGLEEAPSV